MGKVIFALLFGGTFGFIICGVLSAGRDDDE